MTHGRNPRPLGHPFDLPPRWRWLTIPVLAVGGGGVAATTILEEEALTFATCATLASILVLGAPMLWLVWRLFNDPTS